MSFGAQLKRWTQLRQQSAMSKKVAMTLSPIIKEAADRGVDLSPLGGVGTEVQVRDYIAGIALLFEKKGITDSKAHAWLNEQLEKKG